MNLGKKPAMFGGGATAAAAVAGHDASGGAHAELFASIGSPRIFYVDSVGGSDSNAGTTPAEPFKTLAKLGDVLNDNITIRLARGSYWAESLIGSVYSGITVEAYGIGERPIIDCATTLQASSFSQETGSGATHTWKATVTVGDAGWYNNSTAEYMSAWDNAATGPQMRRMRKASSIALVESTANSFYYTGTGGVPGVLYVHTNAGTAPSDGQISVPALFIGVWLGDCAVVKNIQSGRALSGKGACCVGRRSVIDDCEFHDGTIHNIVIGSGMIKNSDLNGLGNQSDYGDVSAVGGYFIGSGAESILIEGCRAAYGQNVDGTRGWVRQGGVSFLTSHVGGTGYFSNLQIENSHVTNYYIVIANGPANEIIDSSNVYEDCTFFINDGCPSIRSTNTKHLKFDSENTWTPYAISLPSKIELVGCSIFGVPDYGMGLIWLKSGSSGSSLRAVGCKTNMVGSRGWTNVLIADGVSCGVSMIGCAMTAPAGYESIHCPGSGITFDLKQNAYRPSVKFTVGGIEHTLSEFQTLASTEVNSFIVP